jgi:hypothetical protein
MSVICTPTWSTGTLKCAPRPLPKKGKSPDLRANTVRLEEWGKGFAEWVKWLATGIRDIGGDFPKPRGPLMPIIPHNRLAMARSGIASPS